MKKCVNPDYRHVRKKSALLFSKNFVNIFSVGLFLNDVLCIVIMGSMLASLKLQYRFQPCIVTVMLVKLSQTFRDFTDEMQELSRTWPVFNNFPGLENFSGLWEPCIIVHFCAAVCEQYFSESLRFTLAHGTTYQTVVFPKIRALTPFTFLLQLCFYLSAFLTKDTLYHVYKVKTDRSYN